MRFPTPLDMTVTKWRRVRHALSDGPPVSSLVPIVMPAMVWAPRVTSGDVMNLRALATLLAGQPQYRRRLEDADRVARLASDLTTAKFVWPPAQSGGVRRDSIDVLVALQHAGFVHRFHGRPLSVGRCESPDVVLVGVRRALADNPYRKGRPMVDDGTIMRIAKRNYLDVEPWPFAAIVD